MTYFAVGSDEHRRASCRFDCKAVAAAIAESGKLRL
jgi:hypothetical protein